MWRRGNISPGGLHHSALPLTDWNIPHRGLASAAGQLSLFSTREKKIVLGVLLVDGCVDIL